MLGWCGGVSILGLIAGCETLSGGGGGGSTADPGAPSIVQGTGVLRIGDKVQVVMADIPGGPLTFEQVISEEGKILLHQNREFVAANKTPNALAVEIREFYVPKQYTQMTVTVRPADRYFFVNGEVRQPNRYVHNGNMTLLNAISTAGGFTDFAKKKAVTVTRADSRKRETINTERIKDKPELDILIYPGDQIFVPRRL